MVTLSDTGEAKGGKNGVREFDKNEVKKGLLLFVAVSGVFVAFLEEKVSLREFQKRALK